MGEQGRPALPERRRQGLLVRQGAIRLQSGSLALRGQQLSGLGVSALSDEGPLQGTVQQPLLPGIPLPAQLLKLALQAVALRA